MREFPEAVCRDAGNLSCWELLENELEEKKLLRAELTEMVITIGYSSGHSSTSSEYVWPQWELIKHTYCGITVECGCSIAASDQRVSWSPHLDTSQIYPNSHFQK